MVTCLIHGAAVPFWDRNLVKIIQEATLGLAVAPPDLTIAVSASGQGVYRTIIANGQQEFDALLDRMAELGFEIQTDDDGATVVLPELASAALKSR